MINEATVAKQTNRTYSISGELLAAKADNFNDIYFQLHDLLINQGDSVGSRNGDVKEFLSFKTEVLKPNYRCVGGFERNMNVFFLLAEALWIWAGRKDVAFLDTYNSQLKQYSDDGISYHAAYGFRLRNFGQYADDSLNKFANLPLDQIRQSISMLAANSEDRRVVLQIWDSGKDLGTVSKDLPCNDLLMYKIRDNKLHTTISNRSNDLNLGLTTNIFQFSFISEIISKILGVGLGSQVHNSDSLHAYLDFPVTQKMIDRKSTVVRNVYDYSFPMEMDFNFSSEDPLKRLDEIDFHIKSMISILSVAAHGDDIEGDNLDYITNELGKFSKYLYTIFIILNTYVRYKSEKLTREDALNHLTRFQQTERGATGNGHDQSDYLWMAMNFFMNRMTQEQREEYYMKHQNYDLGLF